MSVQREQGSREWVQRRESDDPGVWAFVLRSEGRDAVTVNIIIGQVGGDDPDEYIAAAEEAALMRGDVLIAPSGARRWREAFFLLDTSSGAPRPVRAAAGRFAVGVFETVVRGGKVDRGLIRTTAAAYSHEAPGVALKAGRVNHSLAGLRV